MQPGCRLSRALWIGSRWASVEEGSSCRRWHGGSTAAESTGPSTGCSQSLGKGEVDAVPKGGCRDDPQIEAVFSNRTEAGVLGGRWGAAGQMVIAAAGIEAMLQPLEQGP